MVKRTRLTVTLHVQPLFLILHMYTVLNVAAISRASLGPPASTAPSTDMCCRVATSDPRIRYTKCYNFTPTGSGV
jgi:hypothetical protein